MRGPNFPRFGKEEPEDPVYGVTIEVDQAIIDLAGEMDLYTAPIAQPIIHEQLDSPDISTVILDLQRTTFIDNTTLGVMMGAVRKARAMEGKSVRLRLRENDSQLRKIFEITLLDRVFEIELIPHEPNH